MEDPILMLTSTDSLKSEIVVMKSGVDEYLASRLSTRGSSSPGLPQSGCKKYVISDKVVDESIILRIKWLL